MEPRPESIICSTSSIFERTMTEILDIRERIPFMPEKDLIAAEKRLEWLIVLQESSLRKIRSGKEAHTMERLK